MKDEQKNIQPSILKLQSSVHKVEDGILVGLLLVMIGMAVAQIILRNLFEGGILWGDFLVRILVLWIGLAGAMVASRENKHISIDLLTRYMPEHVKGIVNGIVELFTAGICSVAAWYSVQFVRMEFEDGSKAFAQVPVWVCEVIIPVAFGVIAWRYFILSFTNFFGSDRDDA